MASQARQLADKSVAPPGRRNLIINGAMQVAQRGTTSTASTGIRTIDRFGISWGQGAVTQDQIDLTSGSPYDAGFRHSFKITNTTASSASSAYRQFYQYIEAQDVAQSGWDYTDSNSYLSFSFWVKSSLAGTYYIRAEAPDSSTTQDWIDSFTVEANTWKKVSFQIVGGSTVNVNNDNGVGLSMWIAAHYGTDYTDASVSTQQWIDFSQSAQMPVFSQDWANTSNATFEVTGVQLEVGSIATEFEHRSYAEELVLCQRYYQKSYASTTDPGTDTILGMASSTLRSSDQQTGYVEVLGHRFPIEMRTTPDTIVAYDKLGTSGKGNYYIGGSWTSGKSVTVANKHPNGFQYYSDATTTKGGVGLHYTAEAEL